MKEEQVRIQNSVEIVEDRKDAVWTMDNEFHLSAYNRSFAERFRVEFNHEPQKGMDLKPIYEKGIFFESCEKGCTRALNRYATTAKHTMVEEGSIHVHEFSFQPYMDTSGNVMGCCIWQKDITNEAETIELLKESDRKYRDAQEIANVGHWNWDMLKDEITWSDQLFSIFGQEPDKFEANYEALMHIIHPEDRDAFNEDVEQSIQNHALHDIVHRIIVNDGEVRYVHQKGRAYYNSDNKPYRMSGTTQDVTKDVLINQQIVQQNNELQNFVRIISHNLRSPISNLLMLAKIYEWGKDEMNDDIVKKIEHTTEALDHTIKDLNLSLSMKNADRERFRHVRLAEVMKDVDALLSEEVAQTKALVTTDFSQAETILGLKSYFDNILYNLILNSIKYQQEGVAPLIQISTQSMDNATILTVSDNGIGMELTPEKERKIFDMYGRLSGATEGKGLGLYLVKTQVEAMEGKITVQSTSGEGTTFTMHFPK